MTEDDTFSLLVSGTWQANVLGREGSGREIMVKGQALVCVFSFFCICFYVLFDQFLVKVLIQFLSLALFFVSSCFHAATSQH